MERILIIDDDITFALMLKTWLSKKGFRTETAASVAAARTALAEGGFSLVLSDMRLPDEDGIALLQWMSGQHMEIPVIVMTSYAEIQNAVRCMKLGARDYVAKPRSEEHTSELQSPCNLVCRLLLEKNTRLTLGNRCCVQRGLDVKL